jgi:hypothetical protein
LGDRDAELEQLTMDLRGAPQWILKAHSSDQLAHLLGDPVGHRANEISIASKRQNPCDANARRSRA